MKTFRRSKKALSPVVASIILIAVTVAVSIAVAVWMGALSTGFMQTEQLTITSATITGASTTNSTIVLGVRNTGTSSVTIGQVWVGTTQIGSADLTYGLSSGSTLNSNLQGTITISNQTQIVSGGNYLFKLISAKGTPFQYPAIAP
ncbi:MAG TPA: archaellin/type IV pilin N-terminal domain-containing protein [Candidatus Bathyarchaeia archaeon]|nr:archaellin/type IV pilin N-terminal domain-containing protein [Candidatus Bathyarchaeia archaeon]